MHVYNTNIRVPPLPRAFMTSLKQKVPDTLSLTQGGGALVSYLPIHKCNPKYIWNHLKW